MENLKLSLRDGEILLDHLLGQGVDIAHDCGGVLACTSCRVVIREGLEHLQAPSNDELDLLDRADSMAPNERLACQVRGTGELVIELPRGEAPVHKIERPVICQRASCKAFGGAACKTSWRRGRAPGSSSVRLLRLSLSR